MKTLIFYLGEKVRDGGFVMTISRQDERAGMHDYFSFVIRSPFTFNVDIISDGGPENQLEHGHLFVKGSHPEYDTGDVHIEKEEINLVMELLLLYPDITRIAQTRILL